MTHITFLNYIMSGDRLVYSDMFNKSVLEEANHILISKLDKMKEAINIKSEELERKKIISSIEDMLNRI